MLRISLEKWECSTSHEFDKNIKHLTSRFEAEFLLEADGIILPISRGRQNQIYTIALYYYSAIKAMHYNCGTKTELYKPQPCTF